MTVLAAHIALKGGAIIKVLATDMVVGGGRLTWTSLTLKQAQYVRDYRDYNDYAIKLANIQYDEIAAVVTQDQFEIPDNLE